MNRDQDEIENPIELPLDYNLPLGWRHPVTGRRSMELDPLLVRAGAHHRRARYVNRKSQQRLGDAARVTQSSVSRFERGLAPSMDVEKLVRLAHELHPDFPIGYCPHQHRCPWHPIPVRKLPVGVGPPREPDLGRLFALLNEGNLTSAQAGDGDPTDDDLSHATD